PGRARGDESGRVRGLVRARPGGRTIRRYWHPGDGRLLSLVGARGRAALVYRAARAPLNQRATITGPAGKPAGHFRGPGAPQARDRSYISTRPLFAAPAASKRLA